MVRRLSLVLVMLLAAATAAAQGTWLSAGEWEYHYYDAKGQRTGSGRVVLLEGDGARQKVRFLTTETDRHRCLRTDAPATMTRTKGKTILTVRPENPDCWSYRLVLLNDGSGGVREHQPPGGDWRADGLNRGLRKLQSGVPMVAAASPTKATTPEPAPPRLTARALVIGNGAYQHFGKLPNPRNDAEAMAAKFRGLGIATDVVIDADREGLAKALSDFGAKAGSADVNILFYAGHGVQVEGVNYMVPTNLRADGINAGYIKLNGIALNAALDYLPAKTRIVFLDACRDNPVSRSLAGTRGGGTGLAPVAVTTSGTLIAYATKDGATAEDGTGKHSPYTAALLEHLGKPQDIAVVLRHVRQSVMKSTANRQEPWEYGSLVGDQVVLARTAR